MLETIASYIWSAGLLVLLLGTGVFLTIRLRFLQFRGWRTILKRTFGSLKEKPAGENRTALTQFQTFSTALAAAMGTGNIIGVAAALYSVLLFLPSLYLPLKKASDKRAAARARYDYKSPREKKREAKAAAAAETQPAADKAE